MNMQNIANILSTNSYPGRGIILGKSPSAQYAVMAYFIMGRSENSRNRVFVKTDDGIKTQAADPAKLVDPSLIIYAPVRTHGNHIIVTNGDQTDTVYDFAEKGESFEYALRTREFEPDAPNYTPRISGMLSANTGKYKLSILKSCMGNGDSCQRFFYEYAQPLAGMGHFIHTYDCDGDPIPSFSGEPKAIATCDDIDEFTNTLWDNLNSDNKVSLFVQYVDIATGELTQRIINKFSAVV